MVKMLGINIDKKLKFTSHVTEVIRKCAYQLNALKRKTKILNTKTKMLIYHTFIEENVNYCPLIWMNRNKIDMKYIENVQKRALRMVFNVYSSSYQELLKRAKTCTLEIRWKRQLLTEVYKATHNLTPPYRTTSFPPKIVNYDLRSNMPISQPKCQTETHGYHSLRNEGTRLWAALPNASKDTKDISTFKRMTVDVI